MGELERPHERYGTTLAVNMECSASRGKATATPRDGVMEKTEAARPGTASLVWLSRSLCGRCGEWETWPRGQAREKLEWQVLFGLFSVGNRRSHSFLAQKKKKRQRETERGPMVVPDKPVK